MTVGDDVLDRLASADAWVSDWPNVLERAGYRRALRLVTKRRVIVAFAAVAAVLVPLAAFAAANDWWFLGVGGAPTPTSAPVVVKEGEWDGHPWQLVAYPSTTDGLCVSVTPKRSAGLGSGAMSCGPLAGVSRTPETKGSADMTITYLSGGASKELPAYIAGPVIDNALTVDVHFGNGQILRLPTFAGPPPLEHVRFYAAALPAGPGMTPTTSASILEWLAGVGADGRVVACLAPRTAKDGISSLSDCR
jgi:hypothetical protein